MRKPSVSLQPNDGLIARALHYLYGRIDNDYDATHNVKASFCEIYNEQVRDLTTAKNESLNVRHDQRIGFFVDGLQVCVGTNTETKFKKCRIIVGS